MTQASPLAVPFAWDLVANDYSKELVPQFELFAEDALKAAGSLEGKRVLDVACGPGTLALKAAKTAKHVEACDFSPEMLGRFHDRLGQTGIRNVSWREADGQALPYQPGSFDAAFSMFGLIFFPDRLRGLAEMKRVLTPGSPVVIGSWQPFEKVPVMKSLFAHLGALLPHLPFGQNKAPLGEPDDIRGELEAAGLSNVSIEPSVHGVDTPSMAEFFSSLERTMAPMVLLQRKMGAEAWAPIAKGLLDGLTRDFGAGPQRIEMFAWISVGTV